MLSRLYIGIKYHTRLAPLRKQLILKKWQQVADILVLPYRTLQRIWSSSWTYWKS
jgi:hypothetical protein